MDEDTEYRNYTREIGTGPCRIDDQLILTEDIYSMFFAACLNSDYIYYYEQIKGTENDVSSDEEDEYDTLNNRGKEL